MKYSTGLLEDFVYTVYKNIGVSDATQLDLFAIARALDISIHLHPYPTQAIMNDDRYYVFINDSTPQIEWWEIFGHEIGHILRHAGNQRNLALPFIQYQEWQADLFALHFCVPTFLLLKENIPNDCRRAVEYVVDTFHVTPSFAYKRLQLHKQKLTDQQFHMYLWSNA